MLCILVQKPMSNIFKFKTIIVSLLLLTVSSQLSAQSQYNCQFLNSILASKKSFLQKNQYQNEQYVEDSQGDYELLLSGKAKNLLASDVAFLIDTFNFFDSECSTSGLRIIRDKGLIPKSSNARFGLSGIGTTKNGRFAISILELSSNSQWVYYFSVFGKAIKLEDVKGGAF